ncbi:dicarboxylate transporter/tellurite-resistance protein TehA [Pasteurella canis]|uniref:dicarboxylate transporter/tellurite-resistance protein TehA n=1 Tax=Pasteurella canis TaxID=753 RepID=UPI001CBCEE05|nr:dicarboxylate transporter/tellurite-resistance protein TehA [Pasteurella canis]UAX41930.1 dicarboxylate transporter/tellurite-resistance protein TehA [Pasteurella canis]UAY77484.1 dicarboxylate transporter/tellurite-resistance protein TehA [Pasteurella canis]
MTTRSSISFPIPINYFGIVLGLSALSLAWRYAEPTWFFATIISESVFSLATLIWFCFVCAYLYKWTRSLSDFKVDLQHPILGSFISLIPITTTLIGIGLMLYSMPVAILLISIGIITQLSFATYYIAGMWRGTHQAEYTTPVIYLPTVATNFVSATALGTLGYNELGMLFFGAGFFSWLMLEPAVLQRLRTLQPIPEPLRLGIGIQLAPAFVGCSAYLAINNGEIDFFAKMLIGYGLLQLLFLIRLLPWIFAQGFTPAMWAFSFGLASMAKVSLFMYQQAADPLFSGLGLALFCLANLSIGFMLIRTFYLLFTSKFFIK